ncbi:MAG: histidine phosphatase family protein [Candidatus Krumholzibacteriota bacterium]
MRRLIFFSVLFSLLTALPAAAVLPDRDEPVRTIFLIRHGEYEHDQECDEDEGCGLVALGRQQARIVADRLEAMPLEFTSIQASAMTRARQTGEIIASSFPKLELVLHRDIRECTPATRREDVMADMEPGEAEECEANLEAAWKRIFVPASGDANEYDIVVCHGNVIRWFTTQVLEVDRLAWLQMSIANCSLTVVQVRADGSKKLVAFADSGHIPYSMTTYPGTEAPQ